MSDEISCEVFRISWPDWSSVTDELKEAIWQVISQGVEEGEPPNRKAFVGVNRLEDVVAGFFAHEDRRLGVQYDKDWRREDHVGEEFEHLFFALVLSEGQVVLQRKRIGREFVTINLPTMRRKFFELIGMVFQKAGFVSNQVVTQPFHEERKKDDLLQIFETYQVIYVKVRDLQGRQIPESLRLFNPDIDKDLILRQVLNSDFNHTDELEARAGKEVEGSNLREAKIVRAAMETGEPEEVRAIVDNQERKFRKTQSERFDMQLDTEPGEQVQETDVERMIRIVRTEFFIPSSLALSSGSLGPLFDWARGEQDGNDE